jgi:membrane fusion protein (multidrug efflux system)
MMFNDEPGKYVLLLLAIALSLQIGCGGDDAKGEGTTEAKTDSTKVDSTKVATSDSTVADSTKSDSTKKVAKKKVLPGVPVKVTTIDVGEISFYLLFSATVEAEETVDVFSQATGLVKQVFSEEGDRVREGQILVKLVDEELKLSEAEARLTFQRLEGNFKRREEIYNKNLLSKEEYEREKFDLEQAKLRWQKASLALNRAEVKSPVGGIISERFVKLGDRVAPGGSKLYTLVNMKSLISRVHVPGRELRNLSAGQPAMITTDFLPDQKFKGEILRISPVVDPASGTIRVTLGITDEDGQLRPGMFVNTHIVTATHEQAVLVPKRAVIYDDGLPHVFAVEDSTASKIQLKVGFEDSDHLEVLAGVKQGDRIVVVGQNGLKDKAKIRIIEGEGLRIPPDKPDSTETDSLKQETEAS